MDGEVAAAPAEHGLPAVQALTLTVNGQARELRIEPRVSLLDALA